MEFTHVLGWVSESWLSENSEFVNPGEGNSGLSASVTQTREEGVNPVRF